MTRDQQTAHVRELARALAEIANSPAMERLHDWVNLAREVSERLSNG
ncbi:MAG: hypothetical protein HOC74_21385 [Gemmatimonadetes bacterium]|jgi:hypothetical protein|nr:hypothetical protein [Gemmatimonadota bacterium]